MKQGTTHRDDHTSVPGRRGPARAWPRRILGASVAFCVLGSAAARAAAQDAREPATAEYTVTVDPQAVEARVTVNLRGGSGWQLEFPEAYAFTRLEEPLLAREPRVLGEGQLERTGPFTWTATRAGEAPLQIGYAVSFQHRERPEVRTRDTYEHPYLAADHGLLVAGATFLAPADESIPVTVHLEVPEGWDVISPWAPTADGGLAPDPRGLRNDLLAVGHWEATHADVDGLALHVAVAPGQGAWRHVVVPRIQQLVAAELALFGMRPRERYLFVFGRPDMRGFAGSPKTGSMTLQVDPALPADLIEDHLVHLIAHEFHHTWLQAVTELPDELRFYNEGFTDYFAYVVAARLGFATEEEFVATVAGKMSSHEQHAKDSGRSLAQAGGPEFFDGGAAYFQTYDGGLVLAAWLDLALRFGASVTLDEFLREFNGAATHAHPPTLDDLVRLVGEHLGEEVAVWFGATVRRPGPIDWCEAFGIMDVAVTRSTRILPLDFRANLQDGRVTVVDTDSAAHALGLRAGDRVVEVNGAAVSSEQEARQAFRAPPGDVLSMLVERDGRRTMLAGNRPERAVFEIEPGVFADTLARQEAP